MVEQFGMIEPFEAEQVRSVQDKRVISYGTSSYGYDVRCAADFKVFTNINSSPTQVVQLQERVEEVEVDPAILDYLMAIVAATRATPKLRMGVSPRGSIALYRAARAYALTKGRTYLVPDDVRDLVVPCLAHRILPAGASGTTMDVHEEAAGILEGLLDEVEAPV
jgi:MoxR-like ATPase